MTPSQIWFDEDGTALWSCNDCNKLIPLWDELCPRCQAAEDYRNQWSDG